MLSSLLRCTRTATAAGRRHLGVACKSPHPDPLHLLQKECIDRQLCNTDGNRLPGVDWRFSIGIADAERPAAAPNIRTVGIERVTQQGIDFVLKRGTKVADVLTKGQELSFLHTAGLFLPGQSAEQWRGEGTCQAIPLGQVIDEVPHFIITSMVGSKRIAAESTGGWPVDESADSPIPTPAKIRESIQNRSHLTEIMQKTRLELENGDVTLEELEDCITALRLQPTRLECMWASPDSSVVWERWEWQRETLTADGTLTWRPPRNLVPH